MTSKLPEKTNAPSATFGADSVLPFRTELSRAEGRIVRLGRVADQILGAHDYPEPVLRTLGEALALVAMLGVALQDGGRLVLEVRSDAAIRSLSVQFEAPGRLRGYSNFDAEQLGAITTAGRSLIGSGHLALTIEPGSGAERYQGVVALDGGSLSDAALDYFRQSEQIPTFIRLAVAREFTNDGSGGRGWRWRAGGLLVQHIAARGSARGEALDVMQLDSGGDDAEGWRRVETLAATVEDYELIDPLLSPERLLLRLFHEEGVRVRPAVALTTFCRCSHEKIAAFLAQVGHDDLEQLRDADGHVTVTCEFCGRRYGLRS